MKTVTIEQSQNTNIHQIASEYHDRDIRFTKGKEYAVLLPSYYTLNYSTHSTLLLAAKAAKKLEKLGYYNVTIIDSDGVTVDEQDYRDL